MNNRDIKIDLGAVQTTLFFPLLARAREAEKDSPIVYDIYARDIVARIDYDFSKFEVLLRDESHQLGGVIRAYNFESSVREFLAHNREAVVINIGAGLDTLFQRVDNGSVMWINIDLPDVVALRQRLIPDSEREMTIGKSVFDFTWIDDISLQTKGRSLLFMAAAVLFYFAASEVEILFRKLADAFPSAHFVFDSISSALWVWLANWAIMRKRGLDSSARMKWHLKKASRLRRWVDTIKVVEEYAMGEKVRFRDDWSKKVILDMKIANLLRVYKMVHVQL